MRERERENEGTINLFICNLLPVISKDFLKLISTNLYHTNLKTNKN